MTTIHTIRVINYCGDYDDLNTVNVIGPYDTPTDRDQAIARLAQLPEVYGSLEFQPSTIHPGRAENSCQPEQAAKATDCQGVLAALGLILPPTDAAEPEPALPGL